VPGHLAVRVVAHERLVGDAAVDPVRGAGEALVDIRERALNPLAQVGEAGAHTLHVVHEVLAPMGAEDGALRRPQPSEPHGEQDR
jgi:hypothetical protein